MIRVVADTHAVLWYLYNDPRLSLPAGSLMDATVRSGDEIAISAISLIEIAYLVERSRIPQDAFERVISALNTPGLNFREIIINQQVADVLRQISRSQIPEMPDRIIAATAFMLSVPLISRDHKIQASSITTIW